MLKLKWYSLERGKYAKMERALQRKVVSLYKLCKRMKIPYCDIYILSSEGSTTLNIRAKKGDTVVVNGYAFARKEI